MNDECIFLSILAEDQDLITYRPHFAALTDSALSAILLQQIIYWWSKMGRKPFYKFRDSCKHKQYKDGQSWCEELEMNRYEFDQALKIIATKITKGVGKQQVLETPMPEHADNETPVEYAERFASALRCVVIYWTDSSRVTWYQVNENLLGKFVGRIYLSKSEGLRYLIRATPGLTYKNGTFKFTSKTETNTETNHVPRKRGKIIPFDDGTQPVKRNTKRKADPLFDAIGTVWNTTAGGWIGNLKSMLLGTAKRGEWQRCNFEPPVSDAAEVLSFGEWAKLEMKRKNLTEMPTACVTIQRWFYDFRSDREREASYADGYIPVEQRTSALHGVKLVG